jgi:hypothetical protein
MSSLRLYATGENLFTITNYSGFDPEINAASSTNSTVNNNIAPGIDYGTYPQTRNIIFGVRASF